MRTLFSHTKFIYCRWNEQNLSKIAWDGLLPGQGQTTEDQITNLHDLLGVIGDPTKEVIRLRSFPKYATIVVSQRTEIKVRRGPRMGIPGHRGEIPKRQLETVNNIYQISHIRIPIKEMTSGTSGKTRLNALNR